MTKYYIVCEGINNHKDIRRIQTALKKNPDLYVKIFTNGEQVGYAWGADSFESIHSAASDPRTHLFKARSFQLERHVKMSMKGLL